MAALQRRLEQTKQKQNAVANELEKVRAAINVRREVLGGDWTIPPPLPIVLTLQSIFRCWFATVTANKARDLRDNKAANTIQNTIRMFFAVRTLDKLRKIAKVRAGQSGDSKESVIVRLDKAIISQRNQIESIRSVLAHCPEDLRNIREALRVGIPLIHVTTAGQVTRYFRITDTSLMWSRSSTFSSSTATGNFSFPKSFIFISRIL
eukprot:c8065_g1_i2.p1 GENE.c8065_g1_i2~~c8065_g1_i2.p1  ORF type:complete len:224 (-),score=54.65 c8065_g1_i2:470-1090(-)